MAAQTISNSVANALECLREFEPATFKNAGPTVKFLKIYDKLFDLMNSRNPFGKGSKTPLKEKNEAYWLSIFENARTYTIGLKNEAGKHLYQTQNKTPFLGFLININSYLGIYQDYVKDAKVLKYILAYKTSQDHLELFFSSIR